MRNPAAFIICPGAQGPRWPATAASPPPFHRPMPAWLWNWAAGCARIWLSRLPDFLPQPYGTPSTLPPDGPCGLARLQQAAPAPASQGALSDARVFAGVTGCGPGLAVLAVHRFGSGGPMEWGWWGAPDALTRPMHNRLPRPTDPSGQSWTPPAGQGHAQPERTDFRPRGFCAHLAPTPPRSKKRRAPGKPENPCGDWIGATGFEPAT